jgi:hypothetical protein
MTSEAWIDTVRVARDMGHGLRDLLPRWARSVADAPYSLVEHISFALTVLRWRENLDEHEIPPRKIWQDGDALRAWFDRVRDDRKREMRGESPDRSQEIEDPVQNEAARGLLVG